MLYIVWALAILLGLSYRSSRAVVRFQAAVYWLIVGLNTHNADYRAYLYGYQHARGGVHFIEGGWELLCRAFHSAGVDYQCFVALVTLACLLVVLSALRRMTGDVALCMSLFLIYPMSENAIQLKTFAASALLLYGISILLRRPKRAGLKYLCAVLAAVLFHALSVYFLILLLIPLLERAKIQVVLLVCLLGTVALYFILPYVIRPILSAGIANMYLSWKLADWKRLGMAAWQIAGTMIVFFFYYHTGMRAERAPHPRQNRRIVIVNLLLLPCCAMYSITMVAMRLYRSIFLLNYVYFARYLPRGARTKLSAVRFAGLIVALGYFVLTVWFFYLRTPEMVDTYFGTIFGNNALFSLF